MRSPYINDHVEIAALQAVRLDDADRAQRIVAGLEPEDLEVFAQHLNSLTLMVRSATGTSTAGR